MFCPKCGAHNVDDGKFCEKCGCPILTQANETSNLGGFQPKKNVFSGDRGKTVAFVACISIAVFAALIVVVFAGLYFKGVIGISAFERTEIARYGDLKAKYGDRIFRPTYIPEGYEFEKMNVGGPGSYGKRSIDIHYKNAETSGYIWISIPRPSGGIGWGPSDGNAISEEFNGTLGNGVTWSAEHWSVEGGLGDGQIHSGKDLLQSVFYSGGNIAVDEVKKFFGSFVEVK